MRYAANLSHGFSFPVHIRGELRWSRPAPLKSYHHVQKSPGKRFHFDTIMLGGSTPGPWSAVSLLFGLYTDWCSRELLRALAWSCSLVTKKLQCTISYGLMSLAALDERLVDASVEESFLQEGNWGKNISFFYTCQLLDWEIAIEMWDISIVRLIPIDFL